jgi:hypothetical protein
MCRMQDACMDAGRQQGTVLRQQLSFVYQLSRHSLKHGKPSHDSHPCLTCSVHCIGVTRAAPGMHARRRTRWGGT